MSAGSDASNLGYGKIIPNSNVNSNFINKDNSHYSGGFGSNEIPGLPGLAGSKNNIDAAAGYVPGICLIKGGSKGGSRRLKKKIKNITKIYKMKNKKTLKRKFKKIKRMASATLSRMMTRQRSNIDRQRSMTRFGGNKKKSMKMKRGRKKHLMGGSYPQSIPYPPGYGQYQNNLPMTPTYSVGGVLPSNQLALANPPPISLLSNCTNCVDNYNHYTNQGFASRGH